MSEIISTNKVSTASVRTGSQTAARLSFASAAAPLAFLAALHILSPEFVPRGEW